MSQSASNTQTGEMSWEINLANVFTHNVR